MKKKIIIELDEKDGIYRITISTPHHQRFDLYCEENDNLDHLAGIVSTDINKNFLLSYFKDLGFSSDEDMIKERSAKSINPDIFNYPLRPDEMNFPEYLDYRTDEEVQKEIIEQLMHVVEKEADKRYEEFPDSGEGYTLHDENYDIKREHFIEGAWFTLNRLRENKTDEKNKT